MNGTDEENLEVHIEKEEDDEEIQARNEVIFAVNNATQERNNNIQLTLKSKDKDVDELLKLAVKTLNDFHKKNLLEKKVKDEKNSQMIG